MLSVLAAVQWIIDRTNLAEYLMHQRRYDDTVHSVFQFLSVDGKTSSTCRIYFCRIFASRRAKIIIIAFNGLSYGNLDLPLSFSFSISFSHCFSLPLSFPFSLSVREWIFYDHLSRNIFGSVFVPRRTSGITGGKCITPTRRAFREDTRAAREPLTRNCMEGS